MNIADVLKETDREIIYIEGEKEYIKLYDIIKEISHVNSDSVYTLKIV